MKKTPRLGFDRLLAGKSGKQLIIILFLFLAILLLVAVFYTNLTKVKDYSSIIEFVKDFPVNFSKAFVDLTNPETLHKSVYDPAQNNSTETTNELPPVWFLFLVYVVGAIVFTGLLIATITNAWRGRAERFRRGAVSYKFNGHIVFLGYNYLIAGMILKILENEKDTRIVVGVENNASVINDKIKNRLYDRHRKNVVVLQADSCNREDLDRLKICQAKEVYIIGEHDDAYNLKCYRTIYELSLCEESKETKMPQCYVNLHSQATLTLFRTYASAGDLGIDFTNFHSFSFYDEWARTMIQKKWMFNEELQDHFIIAGMTEMGIALARKITLSCHNPNDNKRTIITFIDDEVSKKSKLFIIQHQEFFNNCSYKIITRGFPPHIQENKTTDILFEFIEGDLSDKSIRQLISNSTSVAKQKEKNIIALCYDDPHQNLSMGLNLPDNVYKDKKNTFVWLYQPTLGDLGNYLKNSWYKNVITFGTSGEDLDIKNNKIVRKAQLINHFLIYYNNINKKNKKKKTDKINYSNKLLIQKEWKSIDISKQWECIRRAEFASLFKNGDKGILGITKMLKIERKRSVTDNLLFENETPYSLQGIFPQYLDALKQYIVPELFSSNNNNKNDEQNEKAN